MRFPSVLSAAAAIAALAALSARADIFNNKLILVGDKGAALGGAYTGLADDATATYYNPAGMTQLKNIKLNVSAQVVQFQKQQIQIAEDKTIPYNSFNFSPSITSFSQRMGKWAYGFSIVTPQNDLFRGEQSLEAAYRDTGSTQTCYHPDENTTPCVTRLDLSYSDVSKITMIGPSGAMKFSDNISLGVTLYGIYFTQLERTAFGGWDANYVDEAGTDLARFHETLVTRDVSQTGLGFTGTFGILVRMDQGFSFGVNASPGSLVWIDRTEKQRAEDLQNGRLVLGPKDTVTSHFNLYNLEDEGSHTEVSAPRLSIGVSWNPWKPVMLTAQTDWLMGSLYNYNAFTSPDGHPLARSGFEYLQSEPASFVIEKRSVVNFSAGLDVRITKEYSAAIGGYTDFSQGPYDERPASWNRRIDYFGGTFSVGIEKEYTESRFGINAAYGDASITHFQWVTMPGGQPVIDVREDDQGKAGIYRPRRDFDSYSLGIFLSSTLKI